MTEVWKLIPDIETKFKFYEASIFGRIRSVSKSSGKIIELSQFLNQGYSIVKIDKKPQRVHRLIAFAFISKPAEANDTWSVDHIDNDKSNNHVSNLRWLDLKGQMKNRRKRDRIMIDSCPVIATNVDTCLVYEFNSLQEAEQKLIGVNHKHISKCLYGKRKVHAGFRWSTPEIQPDLDGEEWKLWHQNTKYTMCISNKGRVAYKFGHGYIKKVSSSEKITKRALEERNDYPKILKNGKCYLLHVVVCELFGEIKPDDYVIDHKNSNKQDANIDNLRYITQSDNMKSAHDNGSYDGTKSVRVPILIDEIYYESYHDAERKLGIAKEIIHKYVHDDKNTEYMKA
jgi:hypothetical protein